MFLSDELEQILEQFNKKYDKIEGDTEQKIYDNLRNYLSLTVKKMIHSCMDNAINQGTKANGKISKKELRRVNNEFKQAINKYPYIPIKNNAFEIYLKDYGIIL